MTLTELRKALPGWEIDAWRFTDDDLWRASAGLGDSAASYTRVMEACHETRRDAITALADKLQEIGVLR